MFKKFLNLIKNNKEEKIEEVKKEETENIVKEFIVEEVYEEKINCIDNEQISKIVKVTEHKNNLDDKIIIDTHNDKNRLEINKNNLNEDNKLTNEDLQYIKKMKIKRGKLIKAIDVYSNEEIVFDTHRDCSKKIGVPLQYIQENLEYGYTDYFGEAINYLSKNLRIDISILKDNNKNIVEIFNYLHNQLWSENISEKRRDTILSSEKIYSIKMHYKFEIMDDEYDVYFKKYGKIIRRGGKKKIELVDKKNEVIEVFKSLDDCANYFNKDKSEIIERLKLGDCKIGRYEIRYSLTR